MNFHHRYHDQGASLNQQARSKAPFRRTRTAARLAASLRGGGSGAPSGRRHRLALITALTFFLALGVSLAFAGSTLAAEPCPNEQLRQESLLNPTTELPFSTQLPDCRAYEQISSPFKDGYRNNQKVLSTDGMTVLDGSKGIFAGAEGAYPRAVYLHKRIPGVGWNTSAISPSQASFPAQAFVAGSPGLDKTLWKMRTPLESARAENLYLRGEDGTIREIGPMIPAALAAGPPAGAYQPFVYNLQVEYVAASNDLSHVLFRFAGGIPYWPFDTTLFSGNSLYEYEGTGNSQPRLVGLDNAGDLVSNCGTLLGAEEEVDAYNSISLSGETVYFTARGHINSRETVCPEDVKAPEVSELWARLDGAESVAISEPSANECKACQTSVRRPAEFRGASADGSKAFFETDQELLAGATTNNLYEFDFDNPPGQRVLRVSRGSATPEVQGVLRVSQDGSHVYFVAKGVLTGANAEAVEPVDGGDNLYVFRRDSANQAGRLSFVATLAEADSEAWAPEDIRPTQATPDGRYLVFQSVANLTPGDASTEQQVFEYDSLTESLVRVSIGQHEYVDGDVEADTHGSSLASQVYSAPLLVPTVTTTKLSLGADGSRVIFSSEGALAPEAGPAAAAGLLSIYEYRSTGSIANGDVSLLSDGTDTEEVPFYIGMNASAGDVFFETADRLVGQDGDSQFDIYDARSGGGFPAPVLSTHCLGDACQGPASPAPLSSGNPATPSFVGPPDPAPTHRKHRHKKRHRAHKHKRSQRLQPPPVHLSSLREESK